MKKTKKYCVTQCQTKMKPKQISIITFLKNVIIADQQEIFADQICNQLDKSAPKPF